MPSRFIDVEAPVMLTDEQYIRWLAEGWIELTPATISAPDHRFLYDRAGDLYELAAQTESRTAHLDILGDNLRAQIPQLDDLLGDPVIDGALASVLGPDYLVHPHSYCHRSGPNDQVFHQDGNLPWNERGHQRVHRPDWAMLFYYPQDVSESNGPTEIVPGSQYWTVDHEIDDGEWHRDDRLVRGDRNTFAVSGDDYAERDRLQGDILRAGFGIDDLPRRFLHVPAGTVVLAHYDLVHRGSRSLIEDPRYMYKFYFARTRTPVREGRVPAGGTGIAVTTNLRAVRAELAPVVAEAWRWSRGSAAGDEPAPGEPDVDALVADLLSGREDERVAAAYRLGSVAAAGDRSGAIALDSLHEALLTGDEAVRRAASHGLRMAGPGAVDVLLAGLTAPAPGVRRSAAAGIGGLPDDVFARRGPQITDALVMALEADSDDLVRSNVAYSLGQLARCEHIDAERVGLALLGRLAPGAEPINARSWELERSTIRQSAAFALVQLVANHQLNESTLSALIDGPLRDQDRYVQGLVTDALSRADNMTHQQLRTAMSWLSGRRWNPPQPRNQHRESTDTNGAPAWTPSR